MNLLRVAIVTALALSVSLASAQGASPSIEERLRQLEAEGALGKRGRRGFSEAGAFPPVGVADVVERDNDGDLYVKLVKGGEDLPLIRLAPDRNEAVTGAPGVGDRCLVRFERLESGETEARLIKKLGQSAHRIQRRRSANDRYQRKGIVATKNTATSRSKISLKRR